MYKENISNRTELNWAELIDVDTYVTLLYVRYAYVYINIYKHTHSHTQTQAYVCTKSAFSHLVDSRKSKEKKISSKTKSIDAIEKFQKKCG